MNVKLVSVTTPMVEGLKNAEDLVVYCARVSNPTNQFNMESGPKLLEYLIKHKHWSPMEMVSFSVEIVTSRAIAAQILRHRSFSFQEFSQRYSAVTDMEPFELRTQADKNRQSSSAIIEDPETVSIALNAVKNAQLAYEQLIAKGVAKETARFVLPLTTQTTMYMSGTLRSWIHYLELRAAQNTQKEHREIAFAIKQIFIDNFPVIAAALHWNETETK